MTVYVLVMIDWSDFEVVGVFDNEAIANAHRDAANGVDPAKRFHVQAHVLNRPGVIA
jgi:hypothetical protein